VLLQPLLNYSTVESVVTTVNYNTV